MEYPGDVSDTGATSMATTETELITDDVLRTLAAADDWALSTAEIANRTGYAPNKVQTVLHRCDDPALKSKRFENGYVWEYQAVSRW